MRTGPQVHFKPRNCDGGCSTRSTEVMALTGPFARWSILPPLETVMKSSGILYWCLCGLWCSAGTSAVAALLAYLTNWPIGVLCGLATASFIAIAWRTSDRPAVEIGDDDLGDELRTGLRHSNHPGNVLNLD